MKKLLIILSAFICLSQTVFAANSDSLKTVDWDGRQTTSVTSDLVLEDDLNVDGDFVIKYKLDLNGYTINVEGNVLMEADIDLSGGKFNVEGDFHQVDKNLFVNGGELNVTGDYRIEGTERDENGDMKASYGTIKMTNVSDKFNVKGEFSARSNSTSDLIAGKMTFNGNVTDYKGNTFKCTGTHIASFVSKSGKIFVDLHDNAYFHTILVDSSSEVRFRILPINILTGDIEITGNVENITKNIDFNGHTLTINGDVEKLSSDLNLNSGKFIIDGDFYHPDKMVFFNGGILDVKGNYYMHSLEEDDKADDIDNAYKPGYASIRMENPNDKLIVGKDFIAKSNSTSTLTKGTMEFKGNVYDYKGNTIKGSVSHRAVFSGDGTQEVKFASSYIAFQTISTDNKKVKFDLFAVRKLTEDITIEGPVGKICNKLDLNGYTLTVNGSVLDLADEINLNGGTLHVTGDLYHTDREIKFNKGTLKVDKDYISQSLDKNDNGEFKAGYGYLTMEDDKDNMIVGGDFIANNNHSSTMKAGTIEVSGSITDIKKNTIPEKGKEGTMKVINK